MFTFIKLFFKLIKPSLLSPTLLFIAVILQLFLLLACCGTSGVYSGMNILSYTSSANTLFTLPSNSTTLINGTSTATEYMTGYFYMCQKTSSSFGCNMLANTNSTGDAFEFGSSVIRPYFLILSMSFTALTTCSLWIVLALPCEKAFQLLSRGSLPLLCVSWLFALVASVWQEVAVYGAVKLTHATKGQRASGCLWTSAALLTIALMMEVTMFIRARQKNKSEMFDHEKASISSASTVHPWAIPTYKSPAASAYKPTHPGTRLPYLNTYHK